MNNHTPVLLTPVEPALLRLRLPIPFPPGEVNVWLLRDREGWAAVDAGFGDSRTRMIWTSLLTHPLLEGLPLTRLIVTHAHADHVGAAGWLCEQHGLIPELSRTEWMLWRATAAEQPGDLRAFQIEHLTRSGCPDDLLTHFRALPLTPSGSLPVSRGYRRRQAGECVVIGYDDWEVMVGSGHSPEMLMLYCRKRKIFIAADQILPRITPFVGAMARDPWNDPLTEFLATLDGFPDLPDDTLVLPSHGEPWRGASSRIEALKAHHQTELQRLRDASCHGITAYDAAMVMFPRLDAGNFTMAVSEALAHLRHLEHRGELSSDVDDTGVERFHAPPADINRREPSPR